MGRTLNSLYRERRTMKNIALLSLLTLAILQPLAEAQRGLLGRQALRCRGCEAARLRGREDPKCVGCPGLPGVEDQRVVSSVDSAYGREALNASASFGKGGTSIAVTNTLRQNNDKQTLDCVLVLDPARCSRQELTFTRIGNGLTETYIDSRPNCKVFSISCIGSGKGQQRCYRGNPASVLFEVSSNGDTSCIIQMP